MSKRIYVGNLPFNLALEKLKEIFSSYGEIEDATIVTNKFSGRSKGFGFIEFKEDSSAEKAISEMNKKEVDGRELIVKEALPFDPDKPRKSFDRDSRRNGFNKGRRDFNRDNKDSEEKSESFEEMPKAE